MGERKYKMMERKFTDDEIVKALGCCGSENCRGCPYRNGLCHQGNPMIRDARDLIIRQKEENERLEVELQAMRGAANSYKAEVERLQKEVRHNYAIRDEVCKMLEDLEKSLPIQFAKSKSEAIKEFAVMLKLDLGDRFLRAHNCVESIIDNLVKEMTGEHNG